MGISLHSCVEVREPIEMSFGVVSGVGPSIKVLDRGSPALRRRVDFEVVCLHWPIGFNGVFVKINIIDSCGKN